MVSLGSRVPVPVLSQGGGEGLRGGCPGGCLDITRR